MKSSVQLYLITVVLDTYCSLAQMCFVEYQMKVTLKHTVNNSHRINKHTEKTNKCRVIVRKFPVLFSIFNTAEKQLVGSY